MPSAAAKAEEMKRRYFREAVITATPAARLNMLFDKMVFELSQADNGFEKDDLKAVNDGLCRAPGHPARIARDPQDRHLDGGATDLSQLYFALYKELLEANMKKDRAQAQRVLRVVSDLAEAWRRAAEQGTGSRLTATASAAAVGV